MRYLLALFAFVSGILTASISFAQVDESDEGIMSFKQDQDSWRRKEDTGPQILQSIQDSFGAAGMRNILGAEQVYCYNVDIAPPSYEGYTIDNTAVKSFCGALDTQLKNVIIVSLFANEDNISTKLEQCVIKPKLMFRFIRGVDYTDVLLSSPCHSFTIFYGGKMKVYNFSKGAKTIDELVSIFSDEKSVIPFISPALLDQMIPVGVAQTEEQKSKVNQSKGSGPVKSWETEKPKEEAPKSGGWNKLNM